MASESAEEFQKRLQNDPKFQAMMRANDEKRRKQLAILNADEAVLVNELCQAGVIVKSVWDLVNTSEAYPDAIPILVAHLNIPHHPRILEGIIRSLITPCSYPLACGPLIALFESLPPGDSELKSLAASGIAEACHPKFLEKIIQLINDDSHGRSREYLPQALIRGDPSLVLPILEGLKDHPHMGKSARKTLSLVKKRRI